MTDTNVVKIKTDTNAEVRTKIVAVAESASAEDRSMVEAIVAKARKGYASEVVTLPPAVCAALFLKYNTRNRDWRVDGAKSCLEYARRMKVGIWKSDRNGTAIALYENGALSDGQHRLSAAAFAGLPLTTVIIFGVSLDSVDTIDEGIARHASDHAKLEGLQDSKRKQTVIQTAGAYLAKVNIPFEVLRSEAETKDAIKRNDALLTEALDLGDKSATGVIDPLLKAVQAATIAFVLLNRNWPSDKVAANLAALQLRMSKSGESSPHFVAAKLISTSRDKAASKDKLTTGKEMAVIIKAFLEHESGNEAVAKSVLVNATKDFPNPTYPQQEVAAA